MKIIITVMLCAVVTVSARALQDSRTVQTAQGPVRGYLSEDGALYQFFGIPYASAPTGKRRFQAPMPGPIWTEPFEAVEDNIICPQSPSPFTVGTKMQEDCLIANIYAPRTNETNLPVLVYVHGGGYVSGYGTMLSPVSLVKSQKLIAVTFNYRLGANGFLCLGTEGAPGNAGMKDQVALLRWVQKNIANFGGNPEDVTIGGQSAGSASVDLLRFSDMTEGLYNKVIAESAASVSAWTVQVDPVKYAQDFAKMIGFNNTEDLSALEEFYKSANVNELVSDEFLRIDSSLYFAPCLERDLGEEIFLKDAPVDILTLGNYRKVPVLYGFGNMEGIFFIPYFYDRIDQMNERFADFLPADLQFSSEEERTEVAATIKEFYFGDKPVSEDTAQAYIDFYSDLMFNYPILRSSKLQVEAGSDSIYLYEYSFFSPYAKGLYPDFMDNIRGAIHCAQSYAIYDTHLRYLALDDDESEEYEKMKEILREIWINFITTGKPLPQGSDLPAWPAADANRSPHMDFGEKIQLKGPLLEQRALLWDGIYERYYRTPAPFSNYG